jgi:redox-sensitive bicupin YhaK (pirin superfamily)
MNKTIVEIIKMKETIEGAGVRLHRGFSHPEIPKFDPFLLFDDFSSEDPADYRLGFPWHPHRGIETVTYILDGEVRHHDSIGNSGSIGAGEVQWMTAGSGVLHEEMPKSIPGLRGFQLWVNLPQKEKMTAPRYQGLNPEMIPEIAIDENATAKIIAGSLGTTHGPIQELMAMPLYFDISLKANKPFSLPIPKDYNTFLYIIEGAIDLADAEKINHGKDTILLFSRNGEIVSLQAGNSGARFLLCSGKPLNEEIAWRGPIVMNTQQELDQAYYELQIGSFIKNV